MKTLSETPAKRALRRIATFAVAAGFAVAAAVPAHAGANLVVNGGFESNGCDFTPGWTQFGDTSFSGVDALNPFEGHCSAFFGPLAPGGITQTVGGLIVGQPYAISFAFEPDGGIPSSFSASFGGVTLLNLTNPPFSSSYLVRTFLTRATGVSEVLAFTFTDLPGSIRLDAVSVSIPEPATLALLGIGLVGFWAGQRRKFR